MRGVETSDVDEYLDVRFIADRTAVVGKLILYPFVMLVLMVIARLPHFDNWDWPPALVAVFFINFLYAVACQWMLSGAASRIRRLSLNRLRAVMLGLSHDQEKPRLDRLDNLVAEIQAIRHGAFAPVTEQPLVAVLLSTVALGIWQAVSKWMV